MDLRRDKSEGSWEGYAWSKEDINISEEITAIFVVCCVLERRVISAEKHRQGFPIFILTTSDPTEQIKVKRVIEPFIMIEVIV